MSVACQINWASNFVVGIGWPYMNRAMGPYSFVTFGVLLLATFVFAWGFLPETAGRTVAEVQKAADEGRVGVWSGRDRSVVAGEVGGLGRDGKIGERGGLGNPYGPGGSGRMQYVVVEGVDLSVNTSP